MGKNQVKNGNNFLKYLKYNLVYSRSMNASLIIFLAIMVILFGALNSDFLALQTLRSILINLSIIGILCIGMTLVIITGEFDLSIGSIVAFCSVIIVSFFNLGLPIYLVILLTLIIGMLAGAFNGLIVTRIRVNSVITTLGTMAILKGAALLFTGEQPRIYNTDYYAIGRYSLFNWFPITTVYFIVLIIGFSLILKFTKFGRNIYSVGSNEYAARLSGISSRRIKFMSFVLSGFIASIAAILITSQLSLGRPEFGDGVEIEVITIVVLGGISILGGMGSYSGVIIALLLITTINSGMVLIDVPIYWRIVVRGLILIAALSIDSIKSRKRLSLK